MPLLLLSLLAAGVAFALTRKASAAPSAQGPTMLRTGTTYFMSGPYVKTASGGGTVQTSPGYPTADALEQTSFSQDTLSWFPGQPATNPMPAGAPTAWQADWTAQNRWLGYGTYTGPDNVPGDPLWRYWVKASTATPPASAPTVLRDGTLYYVSMPAKAGASPTMLQTWQPTLSQGQVTVWDPAKPVTLPLPPDAPAGWMADWSTGNRILMVAAYNGPDNTPGEPGWNYWIAPTS